MEKWIGKVAVVTGVSGGVGKAIANSFASAGIHVIGIDKEGGNDSSDAVFRKCDVTNIESVKETFKWIEDNFKKISILVNCAGVLTFMDMLGDEDITEKVNLTMNVNFTGLLSCTREAIRLMRKSEDSGMIINICSLSAHITPFTGQTFNVYGPSKAAVKTLSEVLRQELIILNNKTIRVSNLSPGFIRTAMSENFPLLPKLETKDIAQAVNFLLETPSSVNISELIIRPVGERY